MALVSNSLTVEAANKLKEENYIIDERDKEIIIHKVKADLKKIYLEPTSRYNLKCITCIRQQWGSSRKCAFIENDATVIRWDGQISPCYGLMYSYSYYLDNRNKEVTPYLLGSIAEEGLNNIWTKPEYVKFRHRVRNNHFPSWMDCSNSQVCDYADQKEDCWGNSPSCADCLWSQGIVRCP